MGSSVSPLKHEQIRTAARPAFRADERMMVFGTNLSGWVISLADARVMQQLEGHACSIIDAVFAGNPNFILTASDDRTFRFGNRPNQTASIDLRS